MNIRISPLLKSSLIENGAAKGLNLSDYILHILTKEISGQNKNHDRQDEMEDELEALKEEILRFEALAEPFKEAIGKVLQNKESQVSINSRYDILKFITETFKARK